MFEANGKGVELLRLPQWLSGKESACNAGEAASIPGSGRCPREVNDNLFQYFCLENHMGRGAWRATVHGAARSPKQQQTTTTTTTKNTQQQICLRVTSLENTYQQSGCLKECCISSGFSLPRWASFQVFRQPLIKILQCSLNPKRIYSCDSFGVCNI